MLYPRPHRNWESWPKRWLNWITPDLTQKRHCKSKHSVIPERLLLSSGSSLQMVQTLNKPGAMHVAGSWKQPWVLFRRGRTEWGREEWVRKLGYRGGNVRRRVWIEMGNCWRLPLALFSRTIFLSTCLISSCVLFLWKSRDSMLFAWLNYLCAPIWINLKL